MIFNITEDITEAVNPDMLWLDAGEYDVVRFLDDKRIIIDVTTQDDIQRQLAIVPLNRGTVKNENQDNSTA